MPSIKDIPPELLLSIFEYLDIAELFIFNIVFGETLSSIIARAARKTLQIFLLSSDSTLDGCLDCLGLPIKSQLENGFVPPGPDTVQLCHPLFMRCSSLSFQTDEINTSKMTLKLDCKEACTHVKFDFHPCRNGTEPAELVTFFANFHSKKKLPDGSVESILLSYKTPGHVIQVQVDDEMHEGNQVTRKLSHRMPLWQFQWRTSRMPHDKGVELPREWISFIRKDIDIVMQFKRNMDVIHSYPRRPDFRCYPYQLTSFRADWSFRRLDGQTEPRFETNEINIPPSIGYTSGDSNPEMIRDNLKVNDGVVENRVLGMKMNA